MSQLGLFLRDDSKTYCNSLRWFEARYSIQLSYGRVFKINNLSLF